MFKDMKRYTSVPLAFKCLQPDEKAEDMSPIIFLHGLTGSKEHWKNIPQEVANATKRKVYVVDARNHGDSEWSDVFDFDCNVDDLQHFMDYIRAPRAVLVGHSMGGITAIKMALRSPERVEKLVAEDMHLKKLPQWGFDNLLQTIYQAKAAILQVPAEVNEWTAKNIIEDFIVDQLPEDEKKTKIRDLSVYHLKRKSDNRYGYSINFEVIEKAMKNAEALMTENSGEYHGPAAFIYSGRSRLLVGQEEENIKNSFPNAEFVKVEHASHDIHTDSPAEFTKSLLKFILK